MRSVALVVFPGVQALDACGPADAFSEANAFLPEGEGYRLIYVAPDSRPFRASNGLPFLADVSLEAADSHYDLLLVAGGPHLPSRHGDSALVRWLAATAPTCERHGSICTGAFLLGEAGLLDGRRVTTHWQCARTLATRFPAARVEPDSLYCQDGALVTSAGVTAGIDLALSLIAEDHGARVAVSVAKRLVVHVHRQGGQSQFSPYLGSVGDLESPVGRTQRYVMNHLKESLSVTRLAEVAGMSARHFARVFSRESGTTPNDFIEQARMDAARQRLEGNTQALKAIAHDCGFGSPERMRRVFVRRLGVTPSEYRERFH